MSQPTDALISRLRADIELKAEVIKALRAERDNEDESARDRMTLIAGVSTDLLDFAANIGLLCDEDNVGAVHRAVERLKAVCADFADYMSAINGQLVLSRKPVNISKLLSRIACRHIIDVRVAPEVPERIVADEAQFGRLLAFFADQDSEGRKPEFRLLEVTMADSGKESNAANPLPRIQFSLCRRHVAAGDPEPDDSVEVPELADASANEPASFMKLRAALASTLCELFGAQNNGMLLTIPVQTAVDQAHTGIFRLAVSERGATEPAMTPRLSAASPDEGQRDDGSVDLLYLDRQLGSLAPVILERTAPAFIGDAQRRMTDLHVAHECEDLARLEQVARAWKGSALSVGARTLAGLLDSIEKQAAMRHLPGASAIWQVRSALDRVVRALENQGRRGGSAG